MSRGFFIGSTVVILVLSLAIFALFVLKVGPFGRIFEFPNPRGEADDFSHGKLEMDTPSPEISGIWCSMMPILCATTLDDANAQGREEIEAVAC